MARLVRLPLEFNERWAETCRVGDDIMRQAGVEITEIKLDNLLGVTLRRDRVEVGY